MSDPVHTPDGCAHQHRLDIDGLCVSYGNTRALCGVSFSAQCGETVALVGPNGAGKSTLLKCLAGLVSPQEGTLQWRDRPLARCHHEIAYLPQRSSIDWNFPATVRRVVEMGRYPHLGWWRRYSRRDADAVDRALELLALTELQDRQIRALSGGQQQRTFLARAMAQGSHVLLLDEPFTGLDVTSTASLVETLHTVARRGHLVLASHHDLASAPDIFDKTLLLNSAPVAFGPTAEALSPANRQAAYGAPLAGAITSTKDSS